MQKGEVGMTLLEAFYVGFWLGCLFMWLIFALLSFHRWRKELKKIGQDLDAARRKL